MHLADGRGGEEEPRHHHLLRHFAAAWHRCFEDDRRLAPE